MVTWSIDQRHTDAGSRVDDVELLHEPMQQLPVDHASQQEADALALLDGALQPFITIELHKNRHLVEPMPPKQLIDRLAVGRATWRHDERLVGNVMDRHFHPTSQ